MVYVGGVDINTYHIYDSSPFDKLSHFDGVTIRYGRYSSEGGGGCTIIRCDYVMILVF